MAHFAELDENNVVTRVIVGINEDQGDGEQIYSDNTGTIWKQTSYNTRGGQHLLGGTPFRKNYAAPGFTYDAVRDAFIPPKEFESWTLDEETCWWVPPTPMPTDGNSYYWDEPTLTWIDITTQIGK
jgi:hypothetical protein